MSDEALREKYKLLGYEEDAAAFAAVNHTASDLAGAALLRLCWATIDDWSKPGALKPFSAAERLASSGASLEDMQQLARVVAYSTIFRLLYLLDEGPNFALRDLLNSRSGSRAFPSGTWRHWTMTTTSRAGSTGSTKGC